MGYVNFHPAIVDCVRECLVRGCPAVLRGNPGVGRFSLLCHAIGSLEGEKDLAGSLDFRLVDSTWGLERFREEVGEFRSHVPVGLSRRYLAVRNVEFFVRQAGDSVLQLMEDSSHGVRFVFLSTDLSGVPAALLSRALAFNVPDLGAGQLAQVLGSSDFFVPYRGVLESEGYSFGSVLEVLWFKQFRLDGVFGTVFRKRLSFSESYEELAKFLAQAKVSAGENWPFFLKFFMGYVIYNVTEMVKESDRCLAIDLYKVISVYDSTINKYVLKPNSNFFIDVEKQLLEFLFCLKYILRQQK
jgi:hypothetical protein